MKQKREDLASALDMAIRASEGDMVPDDTSYPAYMSREKWLALRNDMSDEVRALYGKEIRERVVGGRVCPPKMASYGSSSRMIYTKSEAAKKGAVCFEKKLSTRIGTGKANLDGYLKKQGAACISRPSAASRTAARAIS